MKILLYDMGSYIQKDLIYYLKKAGFTCRNILYKCIDKYHDPYFEKEFTQILTEDSYDFVMSTNFFPIVAQICYKHNKKYLSWSYDSPIDISHIEYYQYPTSFSFFFDRMDVLRLQAAGGTQIFHLPLAVNTARLSQISISHDDFVKYGCDVSFIGQFYENNLSEFTKLLPDYEHGFIDALTEAQMHVYGYNFLDELISDECLVHINHVLASLGCTESLTHRGLKQSIEKKITRSERILLLQILAETHNVHYYSTEQPSELSHCQYNGSAYYFSEMPKIFHCSKINLCPTLRSIESGIPLRALDILGCKATLLINYQPELTEYFEDGNNIIIYDSLEDAVCKAEYYLRHEAERLQIKENSYQIIKESFSYPQRISYMLNCAQIDA